MTPRHAVAQDHGARERLKLAASGAVGRNAMDEVEVVLETIKYLRGHAPYEACCVSASAG